VRRGPGRTLHGHALVDTIIALGREVPGFSSARLTIAWYLVPTLGALVWVALGLAGRTATVTRAVAVSAAVVTLVVVLGFGRAAGFADLGAGVAVALAGAGCVAAGSLVRA
jgi:hypothetical protein